MTHKCQGTLLGVLILIFLLAAFASATDVKVDCTGTDPNAFHSINDALNTLDMVGPHTVTINGNCHENVGFGQRNWITFQAVPGRYATITNAANPALITFIVSSSHDIVFDHIIFEGGSAGVYVSSNSGPIHFLNCTIQDSLGDGLDIDMQSSVHFENTSIKNNAFNGISISNQSQLLLGTYPTQRIRISGNGGDGLAIDGSNVQLNYGILTVDSNKGAGISMAGGRLQFYGSGTAVPALIQNNNNGITLNTGASATLWGGFRIHNNGGYGIAINNSSSLTAWEVDDANGNKYVTAIDGHSTAGIGLSASSSAELIGAHSIFNNGSASADPGARGGISMAGSSLTIGWNTAIRNNIGPGLRLGAKSDVIMFDMTISGNSEEAVRETNLSSGGYYNPLTFYGNGGKSLYCDKFSVAYGDVGSIANTDCANVTTAAERRPDIHIPKLPQQ
ncbi:MAG TPA: right-handed parallel beta-helix repeat-containing protein [Candidatus Solibacter sp.]|nr:right-handed parallel beta-helix repeat-containing protein [Candidatus Solibacter sp.]